MEQKSHDTTVAPRAALFTSLAKAQIEFETAVFDKKANYGAYASHKAVRDASIKALSKHGLSVVQPVSFDNGKYYLTTMLCHSSGQSLESKVELILDKNNMQGLGSAITYAKRYALSAMIGVVSDDDDDGNVASGNEEKPIDKKPKENSQLNSFERKIPLIDQLKAMVKKKGLTDEQAKDAIKKATGKTLSTELNDTEIVSVIKYLGMK